MMQSYVYRDFLRQLNTACQRIGSVCFTIAFLLALVLPGSALAEKEIDGVVKAGSVDNRFTITVTNPSTETSVGGLSLNNAEGAKWLTNIRIEVDKTGILPPGASRVFTVKFDVSEDAQTDVIETVTFQISADGVLFDYPNPEMTVKIEKTDTVEEDKSRELKWFLVKTEINGKNKPTERKATEKRFEGTFDRWGISESSISHKSRDVDNGFENWNVTFRAN
ncbi:MAG: hypothetical protein JRJ82_03925, partial [Deltaproteobacteria bacterium]|nr:hypothetical protein [Deltaproteobacteria bacterium]